MKNKGFTLIELIAVVVIMGMLLLIIFPATSRLIKSNESKKYDTYYDAVKEQLGVYARTRRDELGGIKGSGCAEDKTLSELLNYEYIKAYEEDKNVSCLSPSDFSRDQLIVLGIDLSRQYVDVRIDNNEGRVSVTYSMICVKNYDDPTTMSLLYKKLVEKSSTCDSYVPEIANSLINEITGKYTVEPKGTTNYLTGAQTNNYVWYSGKMWRITNYDTATKTIKLVSDEVVSIVNYDNNTFDDFANSNVGKWLEEYFVPTLRNSSKYVLTSKWFYGEVGANVTEPIETGVSYESKVGMLNNYEYSKASGFLNVSDQEKNYWLLSKSSGNNAWYVNNSGVITSAAMSSYYGFRPSIVLNPNVTFVNGTEGTKTKPYKLTGDIVANVGTNLNARYPGEYVTYKNTLFRITATDARYTKLIAENTIPINASDVSQIPHIVAADYNVGQGTIGFHYFDQEYSDDTFIGSYLKRWSSNVLGENNEDLIEGDFCNMIVDSTSSQIALCPQVNVVNTKVAIPKVGDLYSTRIGTEYWTLSNATETTLNVVSSDGANELIQKGIEHVSGVRPQASIRPVIVLKNTITITGGNGTKDVPYTIQ